MRNGCQVEGTDESTEGIKQREEGNMRGDGAKVWRCVV